MTNKTQYRFLTVNGVEIFFREAGPADAPTLVLLHGYPTSSHMFRNLINDLSDRYHLIAPDYPGYGRSEQPPIAAFEYSFKNFASIVEGLLGQLGIEKYSLYLMDYGAPVGWTLASKYPEKIETLIVQNGCCYEEGLETFWDPIKALWKDRNDQDAIEKCRTFHSPEGLKWQYTHHVPDVDAISPDNWEIDLRHLLRPENDDIQIAMFYDYQNNVKQYPNWQAYLRKYDPEMLIVYGKDDYIFPGVGAEAYKKDVRNLEFHLYPTGHFALESFGGEIASTIRDFLDRKVARTAATKLQTEQTAG
ncbi:alpha/beta hydrolase [Terrimonas sp. NA20]|uniref:Alpha/beta hydrolase n=1 Tax=Terrimonas ginsenosidimutans TaxID=2908004 RepID=A0ABS9KS78_9BACT|nr:alpha/beta hydrolase [Terrimonas ginsenosidimutans]MCG2615184.1 alpha/beta hydrolase [Terrimonas ginsenosidimutans]